jgi:RNA polymerase sigma-70 factor (TIGR02943 family)
MQIRKNQITQLEKTILNPQLWVKNYADYLYNYAITRLNDEELARDLVQETFLAALEKTAKFEGRSSERTWLIAILKNKVIDVYRKKSSGLGNSFEKTLSDTDQIEFFDRQDGHWKVGYQPKAFGLEEYDLLGKKELSHILQKCLKKLPGLWLAVFTLKHMDDLASETICSELNVTDSNFWVIMHRTKVNLRACLQKNWI